MRNNNNERFGTAFNCMDGRCQEIVERWCKENFGVQFVDVIVKPGIDKFLISGIDHEDIKDMAKISAHHHGSKSAVVVGHACCAGNPVSDEKHKQDVKVACEVIVSWNLFSNVTGLFVAGDESGVDWCVTEVCRK